MKSYISKQVERFLREQKNYKRWLAVFLCLAVIVTIGTAGALKYKGIAVTKDGEIHVHTDDCYREEKVLVCEEAKSAEGHTHDDSCYSVSGGTEELICDKEEHEHDDSCYTVEVITETETDEEGNEVTVEHEEERLTCDKEEHSHDSSCYSVSGGERILVCDLEESEGTEESDHAHDESCYKIQKVLICEENTEDTEEVEEEPVEEVTEDVSSNDVKEEILEDISGNDLPEEIVVQECEDEDGTVKVIAEYGPEAGLPKDAELRVKRIKEDDAEFGKYEEEFKEELEDEEAVMGLLLDIGFYIDGEEVEPTGTVSITVQMLDKSINVAEKTDVVHFGKEIESFKNIDVEEGDDGSKSTSFEAGSFSTYGMRSSMVYTYIKYTPKSVDELDGKTVLITLNELIEDGNSGEKNPFRKILLHNEKSNSLNYKDFSGEDKFNMAEEAIQWTFQKEGDGFYIQLFTTDNYININESSLRVSSSPQKLYIDVDQEGKIGVNNGNGADLYFHPVIDGFQGGNFGDYSFKKLTLYISEEIEIDPDSFIINYYQNEWGIYSYEDREQTMAQGKGKYLGKKTVKIIKEGDKELVTIPLTGETEDENKNIGDLGNLSINGLICRFYGWSYKYNSNYKWDQEYSIYCGENFEINGVTVPTYVKEREIILDVTGREQKSVDLYAIWAVPNEKGFGYTGGSSDKYPEGNGEGVKFFVNVTGQIPHEPGSFPTSDFTKGIKAKDKEGNIVNIPLKYWMHIYGSGNVEAIHANLTCVPTDKDILDAIEEKGNVIIDDETINFAEVSLESFKEDYYVEWYVCKDHDDNWHIDGALIKKSNWRLKYEGNGVTIPSTIIPGTSYSYKNTATIKNTIDKQGQQSDKEPEKTGYNFTGWNTEEDGSGTWFYLGDVISVDQETGQVSKGGSPVRDLVAEKNDNDVRELTLYAQWTKGTNFLKVTKTDTNNIPLKGAKFTLYECELNANGTLQPTKVGEATTSENGILTINDLKNDTYYRLDESYAPNGYGKRTIYFSVVVSEKKDEIMSISILNEKAEEIDTPIWLEKEYIGNGSSSGTGGIASINFKIQDEAIFENVIFKKMDENDKLMEDVQFELYREEDGENGKEYIKKAISNETGADGVFSFSELSTLPYGKYCLKEIKAPTNYKKVAVYFEINDPIGDVGSGVVVTKVAEINGTEENEIADFNQEDYSVVSKTENGTMTDNNGNPISVTGYSYTLTIKNQLKAQPVILEKRATDGTEKLLGGAKFSIYKAPKDDAANTAISEGKQQPDPNDKVMDTEETEESGRVSLGNLDADTYYLFEEKAPEGYILPTKPVKIVVRNDGVTVYNGGSETAAEFDAESKAYIVKIYNSTGAILPEAGGPGTVTYTFGGLAVIAVGLMYGLSMRRKREKGGLN